MVIVMQENHLHWRKTKIWYVVIVLFASNSLLLGSNRGSFIHVLENVLSKMTFIMMAHILTRYMHFVHIKQKKTKTLLARVDVVLSGPPVVLMKNGGPLQHLSCPLQRWALKCHMLENSTNLSVIFNFGHVYSLCQEWGAFNFPLVHCRFETLSSHKYKSLLVIIAKLNFPVTVRNMLNRICFCFFPMTSHPPENCWFFIGDLHLERLLGQLRRSGGASSACLMTLEGEIRWLSSPLMTVEIVFQQGGCQSSAVGFVSL